MAGRGTPQDSPSSFQVHFSRHEARTVRDGTDAVDMGEQGRLEPVRERRPSASRRGTGRTPTPTGWRCWPRSSATRRPTARRSCGLQSRRCIRATPAHIRSHQRRFRSEPARPVAPHRTRRRGRDDAPELHADARVSRGASAPSSGRGRSSAAHGGAAWRPDLAALDELVSAGTKVIAICNPNNPTGARLTETELDGICRAAARVGAWIVSDEIYRGAEMRRR